MINHEIDLSKIFYHRLNYDFSKYKNLNFIKGLIRLLQILIFYRRKTDILTNNIARDASNNVLMVITSQNQLKVLKQLKFNKSYRIYCFHSSAIKEELDCSCDIEYINLDYLLNRSFLKIPDRNMIIRSWKLGILFSELDKIVTYTSTVNVFFDFCNQRDILFYISANDHSYWQQTIKSALPNNVTKVFFQHALTNPSFLPIDYNIAFLWGQRSINLYSANNIKAQLVDFGKLGKAPVPLRKNRCVDSIGIALNKADNLNLVNHLASQLIRKSYKIVIRPHPNMKDIRGYFNDRSDTYFERIDVQIAGLSGIHIDAIERSIPSYTFPWLDYPSDFIGSEIGLQSFNLRNETISCSQTITNIISRYQSDVEFETLIKRYDYPERRRK